MNLPDDTIKKTLDNLRLIDKVKSDSLIHNSGEDELTLESLLRYILLKVYYQGLEDKGYPDTDISRDIEAVKTLIRTEQKKLLAAVREQTTIFKVKAHDKYGQPHLYEAGRGTPLEVLNKLEAEL